MTDHDDKIPTVDEALGALQSTTDRMGALDALTALRTTRDRLGDDVSYIVVCRGDHTDDTPPAPGPYVLATRRVFGDPAEAEAYAIGINHAREPLVIAGRFAGLRFDDARLPTTAEQTRAALILELNGGPLALSNADVVRACASDDNHSRGLAVAVAERRGIQIVTTTPEGTE